MSTHKSKLANTINTINHTSMSVISSNAHYTTNLSKSSNHERWRNTHNTNTNTRNNTNNTTKNTTKNIANDIHSSFWPTRTI